MAENNKKAHKKMKNKVNIAELLKDCPTGMELDCLMYDNVTLECVHDLDVPFPITIRYDVGKTFVVTKYGQYDNTKNAKCIIFPKGQTTWEGFQRPLKDGDIIVDSLGGIHIMQNSTTSYCYFDRLGILDKTKSTVLRVERLATEKEKEKLFEAIRDNGYKWNSETKALEKLAESKFKIGNWYQCTKDFFGKGVTFDKNTAYYCAQEGCLQNEYECHIAIVKDLYDNFKLWTIQDAKDGDVLAVHECLVLFKELDGLNIKCYCSYHFMNNQRFYVDTLHNKDVFRPATKEEREKLFDAVKANGYKWNAESKTLEGLVEPKFKVGDKIVKKGGITLPLLITGVGDEFYSFKSKDSVAFFNIKEQDDWELVNDKFDITALKPFDSKVLVRHGDGAIWNPAFWGFYGQYEYFKFHTTRGCYVQCIPYEGNEHLLGTTEDCDDYFKIW